MADYPDGARTGFVRWADDGSRFLFLSNLRDRKYLDLCEYDFATKKFEILWESAGKRSSSLPAAIAAASCSSRRCPT